MEWTTALPDWEERIVKGESIVPVGALFPDVADASIEIFNSLKVVDVMGSPPMGEITKPWVNDFVRAIFGSYDPVTNRRLINNYFLLISKKNTKSTLAAAIMLTVLILNERQSAEFLIVAPTIEVAKNSFVPARDMIASNPYLSDIFHIQHQQKVITHRLTNATLSIIAAENDTLGGKKATGILVDELWIFGKKSKAENMLIEATGGLASRPEGFVIKLSTQSDEPPSGIFKKELDYMRKVRDGEIVDKQSLPVLYEFPEKMIESGEFKKEENFHITNPNLGASVDREWLSREFRRACEKGEESLVQFFAKHLNVQIGLNLRADRWAGADYWQKQARREITIEHLIDRCEVIAVGIDGGGLDDLLGFYVIGRCKDTGHWLGWEHAWAHPSVLERRMSEAARMKDFEAEGSLTIVQRIGDDVLQVAQIVDRINQSGLLEKVGVDQHGLGGILDELANVGITEEQVVGISQGWKMAGAIKTVERKLAEGTFWHTGSLLMNWSVGNAKIVQAGNAVYITKQASGLAKIDTVMALLDAASIMQLNPESKSASPYNERGLLFL